MSQANAAFDLDRLVRANIRKLQPYSSARSEYGGYAEVFLDANENANGSPVGIGLNRYPDPLQSELKARCAEMLGVSASQVFIGNGSDEAIDLVYRIFCEPGADEAIICPPTYGMYRVSAEINDVRPKEVSLTDDFQLDVPAILAAVTPRTKLIFICSPNNPTGNLMRHESVKSIARGFGGMVIIDEAYIHFADRHSFVAELKAHPNLIILQTFSKAWGMAGIRVGLALADEAVVGLFNRVKPPYNVSGIAQRMAIEALEQRDVIRGWIAETIDERDRLVTSLEELDVVTNIYPSDANFLLVRFKDSNAVYRYLTDCKIVVRDRSSVEQCNACLRITVGTATENDRLIKAINDFGPGE